MNSRSKRILQMCNLANKPNKLPKLDDIPNSTKTKAENKHNASAFNLLAKVNENNEETRIFNLTNDENTDLFNIMDMPIDIRDSFLESLDPACSDQETTKAVNSIACDNFWIAIPENIQKFHSSVPYTESEQGIVETSIDKNLRETPHCSSQDAHHDEAINNIGDKKHNDTIIISVNDENNQINKENDDGDVTANEIEDGQFEDSEKENETEDESDKHSGSEDLKTGRKKRKLGVHIRKVNQNLRMKGKEYLGYRRPPNQTKTFQDFKRESRVIGPSCSSSFCIKSRKRTCNKISEESRKELFTKFWNEMTWDERKIYVCNLVLREEPNQRKKSEVTESRRSSTLKYYIKVNNVTMPVCKKMFLSTFSLREWQVTNWVNKSQHGMNGNNRRQNTNNTTTGVLSNRVSNVFMKSFLENLNKLPSHYCRKDTQKMYLEQSFRSITDLYKVYLEQCKESNQTAMSQNSLTKMLRKMNISLYQPKKDQCDICCQHEENNLSKYQWQKHQTEKNRAREEKAKDKEEALKGSVHVLTIDLQAVKVCPSLMASSLYFKLKLCTHNFTVYNIATHHCTCYWFDETQSDLQASTFASFMVNYVKENLNDGKPIIIYSDGCTYQNRNNIMANALLHLAHELNVEIQQKFLVKGHTQMECDSVHATIERKLKNRKIFLPSDYARITEEARSQPEPYKVKLVNFDFFTNFNDHFIYTSIRPGKKTGDANVVDIRALLYSPKGVILYKLNFDEVYIQIPQRPKKIENYTFKNLHQSRLSIKKQKYDHLQQLKPVLPQDCWHFYKNLPYS